MIKFNVGDKAIVRELDLPMEGYNVGDEVTIVGSSFSSRPNRYEVTKPNAPNGNGFTSGGYLEPAPKFNAGDRVKIVDNTCFHEFEIREIVTIIRTEPTIRAENGSDWWSVKPGDIEHVTEETNSHETTRDDVVTYLASKDDTEALDIVEEARNTEVF